uniref:Uncharacterized protein n=1 Tax=Arundo donax TaxID=35708 RepID=A0A0A8Z5N0_ARUDO
MDEQAVLLAQALANNATLCSINCALVFIDRPTTTRTSSSNN